MFYIVHFVFLLFNIFSFYKTVYLCNLLFVSQIKIKKEHSIYRNVTITVHLIVSFLLNSPYPQNVQCVYFIKTGVKTQVVLKIIHQAPIIPFLKSLMCSGRTQFAVTFYIECYVSNSTSVWASFVPFSYPFFIS